jgi:hypothetical protein
VQVAFHTDPVDIFSICSDLEKFGAVVIETTRPNFKEITHKVEAHGTKVIPLAARAADGDFHNYLLRFKDNEYEGLATDAQVLKAVGAWQTAGSPYPFVGRA